VLHLVSRIDHRYSWGEFPAENWIVLSREECRAFVPTAEQSKVGGTWTIDAKVAAKVLTHFYPQTETCDHAGDTAADGPHRHRIVRQALSAEIVSLADGVARLRIAGDVRIKHTFYPSRDDDLHAVSRVMGYADVELSTGRLKQFRLATAEGRYGRYGFSAAVQSLP
jgi:hypothetical protein